MKRIYQIVIALCLPLALCGPVKAQHTGPYVGGVLGGNMLMDAKATAAQGDSGLKFDPALQWSAVAGWDLAPGNPVGEGRLEIEYTRRSNTIKEIRFSDGTLNGGGDLKVDSLLFNVYGFSRDNRPWSPYATVGAGAARMEASDIKVAGQPFASGSSVVFAYQLGVGIDLALTSYLNLDIGYRFFNSTKPTFTEVDGNSFKMDYFSHSAVLGMRFGF
ncbi:MAG: porin family protein [Desulfuromonadales bacterium]|nr:porin family protein [Desulfuromonadales bacterium]